jgi:hypothetical protein
MSPYQQEVIDTTLAEFDRNQAIQDTANERSSYRKLELMVVRDKELWLQSLQEAQQQTEHNLQAQLLAQGFQQAQASSGSKTWQAQTRTWWLPKSQLGQQQQAVRTSWIRCSTDRSKRSRIPTIHTIRIDWSTTCTNSTRSIPDSNSRICTTSSSG